MWQLIETANKKIPPPGSNIGNSPSDMLLGWAGSKTIMVGGWVPGRNDDGSWDQSGARGCWTDAFGHVAFSPPTHWMPLPSPPHKEIE